MDFWEEELKKREEESRKLHQELFEEWEERKKLKRMEEEIKKLKRMEEAAVKEIRWRQTSKKHQHKLQRLVEIMKAKPSVIIRKGTYSMCFREEFSIGTGSAGTKVYVGLCDDGKEVAVKRLPLSECEDLARNEIKILISPSVKKERHIVNYLFYDIDEQDGFIYLILDLCEEDLNEYVKSRSVDALRKEGPRISRQILKSLQALHCGDPKILHRDLRPGNILVNSENEMVLADFGISRSVKKGITTYRSKPTETQGWVAVECIPPEEDEEEEQEEQELAARDIQVRYKVQSDIQVTGMLFFYILMKGKHPYGRRLYTQMNNILAGNPVYLDKLDDPVAKDLIQWMLQHKPEDRPSVHECLNHPYLLSTNEQFDLVTSVGNQAEIKKGDSSSPVVQQLNAVTLLSSPSWKVKIDAEIKNRMKKLPLTAYNDDTTGLLRFIRNTEQHWYDTPVPPHVELKIGKIREYFLKLFPTLPVILHKVVRQFPDWKRREKLEKFFEH